MDRDTAEPNVDAFPGPNAREWVEFHGENAAPSEYSHEFVWDVTREADGPFVTDVDGNVLLDFTCHIGAAPLGYNNEKLTGKLREFDLVEPMKIAGQDMYFGAGPTPEDSDVPGSSHLMEKLVDVSSQYGMDTVFLSNSGAEAMENAMKITHDHRAPAKYGVAFAGSFHGRTFGTLSITKSKEVYTRHYPQIDGIETVPFCADRGCDAASCDCGFFANEGSQLRNSLSPEGGHINPDEIAFLTLEPIQGVGGYRFPSDAFMEEVAAVTDEYDIPLVVDEIQSGVGRTGKFWAHEHHDVVPDMVITAKGLASGMPVSAVAASYEVMDGAWAGSQGGTYGGNAVACAAAVATLDVIEQEGLIANAAARGEQLMGRLEALRSQHASIGDVRGRGLMVGLETSDADGRPAPDVAGAVHRAAESKGLLVLLCGPYKNVIRFVPGLVVDEQEIEQAADIVAEAFDEAETA